MGRGSDYRSCYPHFMIFDWDNFDDAHDIAAVAADAFGLRLDKTTTPYPTHRDAWFVASSETFQLGINSCGDLGCLFAEPLTYLDSDEAVPYRIDNIVANGFNTLIAEYPDVFRFPDTAWTSSPLTHYARTAP